MHKRHGLTIVELLIVVVVIAILAAITVVAYNGISDRARNSRLLATIDSYEKMIRLYHADHGTYPATQNPDNTEKYVPGGLDTACLGTAEDYPAASIFPQGSCMFSGGSTQANFYADINQKLTPYSQDLHLTPDNTVMINGEGARGVMYQSDGMGAFIYYYQQGDRPCGRGTQMFNPPENIGPDMPNGMTVCQLGM